MNPLIGSLCYAMLRGTKQPLPSIPFGSKFRKLLKLFSARPAKAKTHGSKHSQIIGSNHNSDIEDSRDEEVLYKLHERSASDEGNLHPECCVTLSQPKTEQVEVCQAIPHPISPTISGSSDYLLPVGIDETIVTTFQREEVNEQNLQVTSTDNLPKYLTHQLLEHNMFHLEVTKDLHSLESRNCPFEFGDDQQDTRPLVPDYETSSSSFPHTVPAPESDAIIPEGVAQTCCILGNVHTLQITHQGGTFFLHPFGPFGDKQQVECCATLEAPPGVVGSGVTVSVHYAIILDGPFKFPEEWERTSVVLYIDCPEKRLLKELLCIKLRHWAVCQPDALAIMKADHTFTGVHEKDEFVFAQLNDFSDCQSFSDAVIFGLMDHFCLICTAMKCTRSANFSLCHTSCYLMKVPNDIEAAEFRVFLMYGVPSWIDAVQEYCMQEGRSGKLQKGVKKIVVSQPSVVLSIERQSGQGWSLWMSEEKLSRDALKFDHFCKLSHADKKVEMKNFLYPPSVECHIVYKETPKEGTHEKNENTLTISSGGNKAQFLIAVWEQKLLPDVLAAPKQTAPIDWPDESHVNPQDAVHDRYYGETSKPLTVQHLMPYINDLADEVGSISGWLGMGSELEVIKRTPGIINPREQLQELLKKWLEDTEHPNAPHTWEYFVEMVRGVRKGHVAEKIVEDVFTDGGLPSDPVALEKYVVSKMADNWYQFGIHLGLPEDTLKAIGDSELMIKISTRCLVMFQRWMEEIGPVENKMDKIEQAIEEIMKVTGDEKSGMTSMCGSEQEGEASSISNDAIPTWVEKMAANWFNFGVALGFSEEDLQSIKDSNDDDVACCSAMMYHWLRTGDQREKTHERLLRAAKEATPSVVPNGMSPEPPPYSEFKTVDPEVPHSILKV